MTRRILVVFTLVILISSAFTLHIAAMPYNVEMYESYNYTNDGRVVDSPAAYVPYKILDGKSFGVSSGFVPNDIFVSGDKTIYIVDTQGSTVFILNDQFEMKGVISKLTGSSTVNTLKNPEGVFVDRKGEIYIADTGNQRIIVVNREGKVLKEFGPPEISIMKDATAYMPAKLVADKAGRIYVAARNINRGLIELDSTGRFKGFMGAPKVVPNMVEYFWKMISTDEQKKRMAKFVPTEYNNVYINDSGFVYATIGTIDADALLKTLAAKDMKGSATPIRKLNPTGQDVLSRKGFYPPIGDIEFGSEGPSIIVDTAVAENGMYSLLDARKGRIFTYDNDGNLLYVFGGYGKQVGMFQGVSSIAYLEDKILVADKATGLLTVFKITDYGKCINDAVNLNYNGKYDAAAEKWKQALKYNSNLYIAYIGIGKAELRNENYQEAMRNLFVAGEKIYYSKAFRMARLEKLNDFFSLIGVAFILLFILYVIFKCKKYKAARNEKRRLAR